MLAVPTPEGAFVPSSNAQAHVGAALRPFHVPVMVAVILMGVSGCSGAASPEAAGDVFVESCSLACTDGSGGTEVVCSIVDVNENEEISVRFSQPMDAATVNASTLQIIDTATGTSPDGLRFIDPLDPRRVIFRPTLSFENGFDYSFERNRSYEIFLPGVDQGDPGPFLRSVGGRPNQSRMRCTVRSSQGVSDSIPGNPEVTVSLDTLVLDASGEPLLDENGAPVLVRKTMGGPLDPIVADVSLTSRIHFEFNEVMSVPTVANNQFRSSPFIAVELDVDGDPATAGPDRRTIEGLYSVTVDQVAQTTSLTFEAIDSLPASAAMDATPALIVVTIPANVRDVAGNPVTVETGGGSLFAVPRPLSFDPVTLPDEEGASFALEPGSSGSLGSSTETGAEWGGGRLAPGLTGGSGRHGALLVGNGEVVVLNTDEQVFPATAAAAPNLLVNPDASGDYPSEIVETSGVFEFSRLQIAPGGVLVLEGSQPARILVRGECRIAVGGLIDASGRSAPVHDSRIVDVDEYFAGPPGHAFLPIGGPGGAVGGFGGDRADLAAVPALLAIGGVESPEAERDGRPGSGVGGTASGSGLGGMAFPEALPTSDASTELTLGGVAFNLFEDPLDATAQTSSCVSAQLGGVGSGAGHALPGGDGVPVPEFPLTESPVGNIVPGVTQGGAAVSLEPASVDNLGYSTRILAWEDGHLRGGASGGGGGNHVYGTRNDAPVPLVPSECTLRSVLLDRWSDHSGASGGGGGGALEILAGTRFNMGGSIDVSGGNGGSAMGSVGVLGSFAMPGGGGSGGSLRLRAPELTIGSNSRLDVSGGAGGNAAWTIFASDLFTVGGAGAPGLVRIEDGVAALEFATALPRVTPEGESMERWVSVAPGFLDSTTVSRQRPDSISGASSCWMRPEGAFTELGFRRDEPGQTSVASRGWTMDVLLADGSTRPFRGTDGGVAGWEEAYGNLIGFDLQPGEVASPIVVRFQGARSVGQTLANPCDIDLDRLGGTGVAIGSVTPWVAHPADLAELRGPSGALYSPTMIRFVILFDGTIDPAAGDTPGQTLIDEGVIGVSRLRIEADPR